MNDALKTLLLKTRKGATASFSTKEWGQVLPELGFTFQVTKTRNTVTEVKIGSPLGEVLTITKEPHYKRISFHTLNGWLKKFGFDLVYAASVRLGIDTPEVEKKLKDLYVRDLTNTGTCPVCSGNFKRTTDGGLVHHGYQRPGDGYIVGDCFAVGYQPWELSSEGLVDFVAQVLRPNLEQTKDYLERLRSGQIKSFRKDSTTQVGNAAYRTKITVEVTIETNKYEFERMLESAIRETEHAVERKTKQITTAEKAIADWKQDELPEVKHAGKFKSA